MTQDNTAAFQRVLKAIETIKQGGMVIMVDDEDRENEGDLVFAASHVCPEKINFMAKEARGLICLSMQQEAIARLNLPMMEDFSKSGPQRSTAFTVSIEAREGVTTGISAADRAHTIKVAINQKSGPEDIVVPGHVFPLRARAGGVLERAGHTEGSVDIAKLAELTPAAVICEIMNDDGSMARMPDLEQFAKKHSLPIVAIADIIEFRLLQESLVEPVATKTIKTPFGEFKGSVFRSLVDQSTHLAIHTGEFSEETIVDVRVHRQRQLLDVFSDDTTGGRSRINYGLKLLRDSKAGCLLYLTHKENSVEMFVDELEQMAIDAPHHKPILKSWNFMDSRTLGIGAQILRQLGVRNMRVHMTNPKPLKALSGFGLEVVQTEEITESDLESAETTLRSDHL